MRPTRVPERMARIHARNPSPGLGGAAARNPRRADRLAAASDEPGSGTSSLQPGRSAWCAGALPGRRRWNKQGRLSRALPIAAAAALVAAVSFGAWRWTSAGTPVAQPTIDAIAVLPLRDLTGDEAQQDQTDGITDAVISSLAQVRSIDVTSRTSVMRYKGTTESQPSIARALGVDAIVDGSLRRAGGRILVSARVISADGRVLMPARDFDAEQSDLLKFAGDGRQDHRRRDSSTGQPRRAPAAAESKARPSRCYSEDLLGRHSALKQDEASLRRAIGHFERALAIQPDYALAYAELSVLWSTMRTFEMESAAPSQRAAASRALALDPDLAEAHLAAGGMAFDDWDWNNAVTEFSNARELNPNSIDVCGCLATVLSALGRHAEAISLIEHAVKVNPLSNRSRFPAGLVHYFARRYTDAERHLRLSLELEPENYPAPIVLANVLTETGRAQEAIQLLDRPVFWRSVFMAKASRGGRTARRRDGSS